MGSSTSLPPYHYQPLVGSSDLIRILLLEPADSQDEILRGSLVMRSPTSFGNDLNTHYAALSYVWGDPSRAESIELTDGGERFRHGLTTNLYNALVHIREEHRAIWIWADAICIDQSNTAERSHQVKMMGDIYRNAGCTIIYLGHLNSTLRCLFETTTHQSVAEMNSAAEDLCSREWFSRGWVFQEMVLSRNPRVQCDRYRVGWQQLCSSIQRYLPTPSPGDILRTMDTARNDDECRTFSQLVISRKGTSVSDPRDYFFCLMGIASDADAVQHFLPTDYRQGVRDVFIKAARYMVNDLGPSAVLAHVDSDTTRFGLPWFVPAWGVTNLQSTCPVSPGRFISPPSEVDVFNQCLIRPLKIDRLREVITEVSAITTSESGFVRLFRKYWGTNAGYEFSWKTNSRYQIPGVWEPGSPSSEVDKQKAKWYGFGKAVRDRFNSGRINNSDDFKEAQKWRIPDIDLETNDYLKFFWSMIKQTVLNPNLHEDCITNDKTRRYRWALSHRGLSLVPPDTVRGDFIVEFGSGNTRENIPFLRWKCSPYHQGGGLFVVRNHFQGKYDVVFGRIFGDCESSLPWFVSERDKEKFKREHIPAGVSFCYGEALGLAIVLEDVRVRT